MNTSSSSSQDKRQKYIEDQFLLFRIHEEWFSLPAISVRDVMYAPPITPVPLSGFEVAGLLNLRGHIVTALHSDRFFNLSPRESLHKKMCIVLQDDEDELYSFIVDKVCDIESLNLDLFEPLPMHMCDPWEIFADGVFRLQDRVIIGLSREKMLKKLF